MSSRLLMPSRRTLLRGTLAAGLGGLVLPRGVRAAASPSERRFLFIFANGGWDLSWGLCPMFDNPSVDTPTDGSALARVGDISYVSGPERPWLDQWFRRWGSRACLLHGFEVRSVAHQNCQRLLLTGGTEPRADDWPTLIAAHGVGPSLPLPHLVLSGPGFASSYPQLVGHLGSSGQLGALLDHSILDRQDVPAPPLADSSSAAVEAWLTRRRTAAASAAPTAAGAALYADMQQATARIPELEAVLSGQGADEPLSFSEQLALAAGLLANGTCRCAIVRHNGEGDVTWDNHGGISAQARHYNSLFEGLGGLMDTLDQRTGPSGGPLLDDLCIVVVSEMSRHPKLNGLGGKDHWTWTSALLLGAGIPGGRTIGGYSSDVFGLPIDLASGESTDHGEVLQARHLGATLLALADIDPAEVLDTETPPIRAISG